MNRICFMLLGLLLSLNGILWMGGGELFKSKIKMTFSDKGESIVHFIRLLFFEITFFYLPFVFSVEHHLQMANIGSPKKRESGILPIFETSIARKNKENMYKKLNTERNTDILTGKKSQFKVLSIFYNLSWSVSLYISSFLSRLFFFFGFIPFHFVPFLSFPVSVNHC